jgi:hypothetical protein
MLPATGRFDLMIPHDVRLFNLSAKFNISQHFFQRRFLNHQQELLS